MDTCVQDQILELEDEKDDDDDEKEGKKNQRLVFVSHFVTFFEMCS